MKGAVKWRGAVVEWEMTPWGVVKFGGIFSFPMPGGQDNTTEAVNAAVCAWHSGYEAGKHAGRAVLQNEFRNLMDCQPR